MSSQPTKFFERYTILVTETDLVRAMDEQMKVTHQLLDAVQNSRASQVDPPYGWTIKQVVQHMIDAERVFGYRALRFSRGDTTSLPGFDENAYASSIDVSNRSLVNLLEEWDGLRTSHVQMFNHLDKAAWARKGTASAIEWSVTDLAKAIIGHARHHLQIIEMRLNG